MRAVVTVATIAAAVLVSACGSTTSGEPRSEGGGTVEGSPQNGETGQISIDELYDPCQLPDAAVAETGVDVSSKGDPLDLVGDDKEWTGCSWTADGYYLVVLATTRSVEEFHDNDLFSDFRPAEVPGRDAETFVQGHKTPPGNCTVFYETLQGVIQVAIDKWADRPATEDYCTMAVEAASVLDESLPK